MEVEPLTCWWRTSTGAVRLGEPFSITLTLLAARRPSAARVLLDESRLDPSVIQVPPFDVLGGARADDIGTPGRRFLQYRYDLRLIAESAPGSDVQVPALTLGYRVESRAPQGDPVQGRDLAYALPPLTVHVLSLVPGTATDIREAPVVSFSDIAATSFRATVLRATAIILFVIGTLLALIAVARGLCGREPRGACAPSRRVASRRAHGSATRTARRGDAGVRRGVDARPGGARARARFASPGHTPPGAW